MSQNRSIDAQQFAAIIPRLFDCKGLGQRNKPLVEANIFAEMAEWAGATEGSKLSSAFVFQAKKSTIQEMPVW